MRIKKLKMNQLEVFAAVVDAGIFNSAAVELGCTQSRISHLVGELEAVLGTRLLLRSRLGCVVTESGQQVLTKARQILRISDSIIQPPYDKKQVIGMVRISCFRSVATHLLPYVLERLGNEYPGINLEINDGCADYADVIRDVDENVSDLGISRGVFSKSIVSFPFISDAYVFVVPVTFKLDAPVSWEQFADFPFIQTRNVGASWVTEQCRLAGFINTPVRKMVNESGIVALIRRGMGFSILPRLAAFNESEGVKIIDLPIDLKRRMELICNESSYRLPLVKTVIKVIRDKQLIARSDAYRARIIHIDY